jgi:hypothetical protein
VNVVAVCREVRTPSEKAGSAACSAFSRLLSGKVLLALLVAASVVATANVASAEMTLRWDAPPSCPQRDEVLERIRKLAGSSLDKTDGLSVEGSIERTTNGRYSLTILVRDERDVRKRVIASDSCADLAGAAAVTLALLLGFDVNAALTDGTSTDGASKDGATSASDPNATNDPTRSDATPQNKPKDAQSNPNVPPPVKPPPRTPDPSSSEEHWAFVLRAPTAHADFGPLPRVSLGLGAGAGARYGAWRFLLAGHVSRGQDTEAVEQNEGSGAELHRLTAEVSACRGFRFSSVEVAPCAAVALEHVTARGFGPGVTPQSANATWPAAGLGAVAYLYPTHFLAVFVSATGYVEFSRPRLVIQGVGEIAEFSPVAAFTAVGAEWIF